MRLNEIVQQIMRNNPRLSKSEAYDRALLETKGREAFKQGASRAGGPVR